MLTTDFIGMHFEFNADRTAVHITQPLKTDELIEGAGLQDCKPAFTPGVPNTLVSARDSPAVDDVEQIALMKTRCYKKRIGQCLWLARGSRPDIAYQARQFGLMPHGLPIIELSMTTIAAHLATAFLAMLMAPIYYHGGLLGSP